MKTTLHTLLIGALSFGFCTSMNAAPEKRAQIDPEKPLKIVFDNDVHGSIEKYELLAGYRDALKKAGYPVLTVSAGDYLQGSAYSSVSKGQFCVDMMNAVGYDVVAVGNHDIDYGIPHLLAMRDSLKNCAVICSNLFDVNGKRVLAPYTICHISGYRVAFVGVLTTAAEVLQANVVFDREGHQLCSFGKDSLVKIVQESINAVRRGRPDWVILLTHMGEEPLGTHLASWQLVEQLTGVDVVIDAHTHSVVNSLMLPNTLEHEIIVAQTGSGLKNIGCLTLQLGEVPQVKLYATTNMPQNDNVHKAFQVVEKQMEPILGQIVGYTPFELNYSVNGERAVRKMETNLGDLVADAYRIKLGTDIGWVNGGGLRHGIDMGDISYGQIVSVSPFNNFMCVAKVSGQMIADALEEAYSKCPIDLGSFAHISGLRCTIDTTIHNQLNWDTNHRLVVKGNRRVSNIEVYKDGAWRAMDMKEYLTIGGTDYVIFDGELQGLKNAKLLKDRVMTDTECLQQYIMDDLNGIIPSQYSKPQGRINLK